MREAAPSVSAGRRTQLQHTHSWRLSFCLLSAAHCTAHTHSRRGWVWHALDPPAFLHPAAPVLSTSALTCRTRRDQALHGGPGGLVGGGGAPPIVAGERSPPGCLHGRNMRATPYHLLILCSNGLFTAGQHVQQPAMRREGQLCRRPGAQFCDAACRHPAFHFSAGVQPRQRPWFCPRWQRRRRWCQSAWAGSSAAAFHPAAPGGAAVVCAAPDVPAVGGGAAGRWLPRTA